MKKLHLICNAHLDLIWQWQLDEGLSAAISTFQSAVNLCEEFDYIFCHNESILYEAIEQYNPALFSKIQALVKSGKWRIMGGWYLQPDCTMPTGESLIRHTAIGKKYFYEKFGAVPEIAVNFDSFGHSVGLPQILKKSGYRGYITCRPKDYHFDYPHFAFNWTSPDGSSIAATQTFSYAEALGKAADKIKERIKTSEVDVDYVLWGVGNHGGGPSRKDLNDIAELMATSDVEIVHSTLEQLFDELEIKGEVKRSLVLEMPGCYISMYKLKATHRKTENMLLSTEKMMTAATLNNPSLSFDMSAHDRAVRALLLSQFHDTLPGTCTLAGEENGLRLLGKSYEESDGLRLKAFFSLLEGHEKAADGEYPILVFNFMPYEYETEIEAEFQLADQNWTDKFALVHIYDDKEELACQQIKEESTINLDWRKKIIFKAKLKPMQLNRFSVFIEMIDKKEVVFAQNFDFSSDFVNASVKNGFLNSLNIEGKDLLLSPLKLLMYEDSADPWAMDESEQKTIGHSPKEFVLMTERESGLYSAGKDIPLSPVRVVEDGDVVKTVEAVFACQNSKARIEYRFYKNLPYVDINIDLLLADKNKLIRLAVPTLAGKPFGDGTYTLEEKFADGRENVFQKLIATENPDTCIGVLSSGVYACKVENSVIELSLVRSAGYCFHPIPDRQVYPEDRYLSHMDMGSHRFSFRVAQGDKPSLYAKALQFNQKPYAITAFPSGGKNTAQAFIEIDNKAVAIECIKPAESFSGTVIRLFNPSDKEQSCNLTCKNAKSIVKISPYEIKTVLLKDKFTEVDGLPV